MGMSKKRFRGCFALSLLVILCLIIASALTFFAPTNNANAITDTDLNLANKYINLGNLLFNDYENKSKIFNGNQLDALYSALLGETGKTYDDIKTATSGRNAVKTSENFRNAYNRNRDIVVTLGGYKWNVVYLSNTKSDGTGDPIVTLWLANSNQLPNDYRTAKWNYFMDKTGPGDYPSNMYSTSMIRTLTLNNEGTYYENTSGTNPHSVTPSESNPFAIFTMENSATLKGSLYEFLVTPSEVYWQEKQSAKDYGIFAWDCSNDSYVSDASDRGFSNVSYNYYDKSGYTDWTNDKIWLPSFVETGRTDELSGLWKTDVLQRSNTNGSSAENIEASWSRSASFAFYHTVWRIFADGNSSTSSLEVTSACAVRPALHLNLAEVEAASARSVSVPLDKSNPYNGGEQGIEAFYTSEFLDAVNIEYYKGSTRITAPKEVDTYSVKYTLKSDKYYWSDGTSQAEITKSFEITPMELAYPSIYKSDPQKYDGGNPLEFTLIGYDKNTMKFYWADTYSGVGFDDSGVLAVASAKNVGEYKFGFTLIDTKNYDWKSTSELKIKVTQALLMVDRITVSGGNNTVISGTKSGGIKVDLYMDANGMPKGSDTVPIIITAKHDILGTIDVSDPINIGVSDLRKSDIALKLGGLISDEQYKLGVRSADNNYDAGMTNSGTLDILDPSVKTNITWNLYEDGELQLLYRSYAELNENDITLSKNLTYSGKAYQFKADLPDGYNLDTSYENQGYLVAPSISGNSAVGINADTYITSIKLRENGQIYTIKWTIDKAKFNLSNVKWEGNGEVEYRDGNIDIQLENVPELLKPEYVGSTSGMGVGNKGTVTVSFEFKNPDDANNWEKPDKDVAGSFEGTFSEWSKDWSVVQAVIKLDWELVDKTSGGKTYRAYALKDGKGAVEYVYYTTDSSGIIDNSIAPITEDRIVVSDNEVKYYKAYPRIKSGSETNYKFEDNASKMYSGHFAVGNQRTPVTIGLVKDKVDYNGKSQPAKINVTGVPDSAIEVKYYDGYTELSGAPTEVGKYRVKVTLNSTYADSYEIVGDSEFDYEIEQAKIAIDWNTNAKPNVLNLKYGQINGVEYEIFEEDGTTPVEFSNLQAGKTYKIKAKIKAEQKNNYIFADDTYETGLQEFSVSANDKLYDPNDPKNPNYPQVDPDDPNAVNPNDPNGNGDGDGDGDGDKDGSFNFDKVGEVLKQWWQIIASVISIILIIIFTSKGISYAGQRKKIKRTMEKRYSGYYAVAGTGLFGWAYTTWTAIAGILMGVAVLSLVFMLLEKRSYNKALEEMEDAKEEYERNKEERNYNRYGAGAGMQGGYAYAGQGLGAEEIRGIVSETMTALLPSMQQMMLPQQASTNDELIQQLIEQNAQNEERMRQMSEENEKRIEKLMEKLANQKTTEKIVEKEVASASISEETLDRLASKLQASSVNEKTLEKLISKLHVTNDETILKVVSQGEHNDETIKRILDNQDKLMQKILELSMNKPAETQVVEKIVEKEVPVEVEKVVEKIVEVPVEKIVEKQVKVEVPVEVEKIVEKEVVKEVKVEVPVEVEKVVEKIVEIPAAKPAPKAKAAAPRLTLDEAYAKLTDKQKKFFDTLKAYAMSKDKCKEKKSTYFTVLGQSTVNPLVKLTIKKNTTVALFKMEDEYMKDIRRNATSDGTKVKVKETELIVGDAQALATAKEMIDLREDQIERYNEYLKEQRSMK